MQFNWGKINFGSQFQRGSVHHGEGLGGGEGDTNYLWPQESELWAFHISANQEAEIRPELGLAHP